tara:strand:+ start:1024 stop:1914 length:891 start_codon:yes stop_codon:yes gene_type:complete
MFLISLFILTVVSCSDKEEESTTVTDESISIIFIYPDDQVLFSSSYLNTADITGVETFPELFSEMINKLNTIYLSQGINNGFKLAGYEAVNYSSYESNNDVNSADCSDWKVCLNKALMNPGNSYQYPTLQSNLSSLLAKHNADCLVYWRTEDDSTKVNGAAAIGATKGNCMLQLQYRSLVSPVTFAHELGHLHGCEHGNGLDTSIDSTRKEFTINNTSYTKHIATIMKGSYAEIKEYVLWKFSDINSSLTESTCSVQGYRAGSTCNFSSSIQLGYDSSHTCLTSVKKSMSIMSQFR